MTAEAQLERLLWLIPAASGKEGSPLADIAAAMQASVDDVMRDVEAGGVARLAFRATVPGRFEVELEDRRTPLAEITVS